MFRRRFTKEFKLAAVRRLEAGESGSALARELEVKRAKLYDWLAQVERYGVEGAFPGPGRRPDGSALRRMGMNGEFNFRGRNPVKIRCCQYLNNVVEQDHRRVKGRLRPMLGFKTFYNARRVIIGIELAQKIHKLQFAIPITLQPNPAVTWRHVMAA